MSKPSVAHRSPTRLLVVLCTVARIGRSLNRWMMRCDPALAPTTFIAMTFLAVLVNTGAQAQGAFYTASLDELPGAPGSVIRYEPLPGAPVDASAYRVLYRSTGLKGEPIAVSGVIIVPAGQAPPGGRPIVAWAHPTSGLIPRCAPSLAIFLFQQIQGSREMLERGYIIAATDYPGLGTPGPHPYLVGLSEGRAVLDSTRAARAIVGPGAGRRVALWGHSQGGQAVLYAGLLAGKYAPELEIAGLAGAAPATELGRLIENDLATSGGKDLLAMTLWSWSRVFNVPIDTIVDPSAIPVMNRLANECIESPIDIFPRQAVGRELQRRFLSVDNLMNLEPWRTLLAENTIGTMPPEIPVFLAQGTADNTITPAVTAGYKNKLCAAGSRVRFVWLPGVGHGLTGRDSADAAVAWMADRFAGVPSPNDCQTP
jgi:alpha-beta hydrolase superfamily lysophospholipase